MVGLRLFLVFYSPSQFLNGSKRMGRVSHLSSGFREVAQTWQRQGSDWGSIFQHMGKGGEDGKVIWVRASPNTGGCGGPKPSASQRSCR